MLSRNLSLSNLSELASTNRSSSESSSSSSSSEEPPKKKKAKTNNVNKSSPAAQYTSNSLSKTVSPGASTPAKHNSTPAQDRYPPLAYSTEPDSYESQRRATLNRFSRVNPNTDVHPGVASNVYNAGDDNYGAKAHRDLIVTRGEGFRKEKQKKKRGSYKGGAIDFQTRSFKFDE